MTELYEKNDEDPMIVATTSIALSQATTHNVTMLNEKLSQAKSENVKLKDEIISLGEKMNKRRKVECDMTPLKENILEQKEELHDVKMKCFTKIQKVKVLENHLEVVSQINLKMESLQVKIEDLDKWRNMENNVPSSLPVIKTVKLGFNPAQRI